MKQIVVDGYAYYLHVFYTDSNIDTCDKLQDFCVGVKVFRNGNASPSDKHMIYMGVRGGLLEEGKLVEYVTPYIRNRVAILDEHDRRLALVEQFMNSD